ncbi:GtrA family protein [Agromyces allii]|uniref:GtrA/DPMS transmembrane domain-containing protein n=1 Tax=Agromyces allii TaxID=393607 RepID=A0ABN2QKG3_9MICO|nr:GtrA family protein [Agromyces allii]
MRGERLVPELVQFGLVGGAGFLLDVGLFNLLSLTVLSAHAVHGGPLYAKVASTIVAIAANWVGNRWLTFRDRRRPDWLREAIEFGLVSIGGSLLAIGCLGLSHYLLHLTSPIADNVSANVVGLALGSAFRFVAYRYWVYGPRAVPVAARADASI